MDQSGDDGQAGPRQTDPEELFVARIAEYQEIAEVAAAKMWSRTYRSEDLIEDWFSWWGRVARDTTASLAIGFSSFSQPAADDVDADADSTSGPQRRDETPEPDGPAGNDGSVR